MLTAARPTSEVQDTCSLQWEETQGDKPATEFFFLLGSLSFVGALTEVKPGSNPSPLPNHPCHPGPSVLSRRCADRVAVIPSPPYQPVAFPSAEQQQLLRCAALRRW